MVKIKGFAASASPKVSASITVGRAAQPLTLGSGRACQGDAPVVEGTAHDSVLARLQHDVAVDELLDSSFAVSHQSAQAQLVSTGEGGPENHDAQIQQVTVHSVRSPVPGGGEGSHFTQVLPRKAHGGHRQDSRSRGRVLPLPQVSSPRNQRTFRAWVSAKTRADPENWRNAVGGPSLSSVTPRHGIGQEGNVFGIPLGSGSLPAACPLPSSPAALLEEGKLQGGTLQHCQRCHRHWPVGLVGEHALHTHLVPVRMELADIHGVKVPVGKLGSAPAVSSVGTLLCPHTPACCSSRSWEQQAPAGHPHLPWGCPVLPAPS